MDDRAKKHIIRLFNAGLLNLVSANWYMRHGYALVIHDGLVVDIIEED